MGARRPEARPAEPAIRCWVARSRPFPVHRQLPFETSLPSQTEMGECAASNRGSASEWCVQLDAVHWRMRFLDQCLAQGGRTFMNSPDNRPLQRLIFFTKRA